MITLRYATACAVFFILYVFTELPSGYGQYEQQPRFGDEKLIPENESVVLYINGNSIDPQSHNNVLLMIKPNEGGSGYSLVVNPDMVTNEKVEGNHRSYEVNVLRNSDKNRTSKRHNGGFIKRRRRPVASFNRKPYRYGIPRRRFNTKFTKNRQLHKRTHNNAYYTANSTGEGSNGLRLLKYFFSKHRKRKLPVRYDATTNSMNTILTGSGIAQRVSIETEYDDNIHYGLIATESGKCGGLMPDHVKHRNTLVRNNAPEDVSYYTTIDSIKEYFTKADRKNFIDMFEDEKYNIRQLNESLKITIDYSFNKEIVDHTCPCAFYNSRQVPEKQNVCLYLHNYRRCAENIKPLKWSYELEGISKIYGRLYAMKSEREFMNSYGSRGIGYDNIDSAYYGFISQNSIMPDHMRIPVDQHKSMIGSQDYITQNLVYLVMRNGVINIKNLMGYDSIVDKYFQTWKNPDDITLMDFFCAHSDEGWYEQEDVTVHRDGVGPIEQHRYPPNIYNHLTQVLWADTTYVGCAVTLHPSKLAYIGNCHYYPSGNIFDTNYYDISIPNSAISVLE